MLTNNEISQAASYVDELRLFVHGLEIPANNRVRAAASCFAIAQEHHHAIVQLIELKLLAAAFSLVRVEFEAFVRGEWLSQCASESTIEAFIRGKEPPKIDCLLEHLEMMKPLAKECSLESSRRHGSQCVHTHIPEGYTYSGGIQKMELRRIT